MALEVDRFRKDALDAGIDQYFGTTVLHTFLRTTQLAILEFFVSAASRSAAAST